jgi:microcystin-dependent protein
MSDPQVIPTGSIVAMLRSAGSPPQGWLLCDGSPCPERYLENLKEYLADKKTLPNLQGYTLVGAGTYTETYTDGTIYTAEYTAGSAYGVVNRTLKADQMPSHQHFSYGNADPYGVGFGVTEDKKFRGNKGGDNSGNYLYGTTWAGGTNLTTDKRDVSIKTKDSSLATNTQNNSQATSAPTVNNPISAMQPSFAINYFIYGGHPNEQSR